MHTRLRAVLRFHLRVGARLALALLVTATAVVVGVLMFLQIDFVTNLAQVLFGARGNLGSALLVLGAAAAVAGVAAPRVCAGLDGWLRHLPVTGAVHRRAATAAIALAEAPLLAILAALVLVARVRPGAPAVAHLAGLPVVALAAAQLALPRQPIAARLLALAAGTLAGAGSWPALAAALPALAGADLAAGRPRSPRRAPRPRSATIETLRTRLPDRILPAYVVLPVRIGRRALGWRAARTFACALLPWLAAALFSRNNQLAPIQQVRAAMLGGGASCALLLAGLAGTLALRRPAWPWARSLPWGARRRVLADAALLGGCCLPLLVLGGVLAPAAVPPLAAQLPWLAVRAAGTMRRPAGSRLGATGELLIEGLLLAGLVALLPWAAALLLAALPLAVRAAAARERRQKVGAWMERHHLAAGDPASWSGG